MAMEEIFLFAVLVVFGAWGQAIGGLVYMVLSFVFVGFVCLPGIGGAFRVLLTDVFPYGLVAKLCGWLVSSTGLVWSYLLFTWISGPLEGPSSWWVVVAVCGVFALKGAEGIVHLEMFDHDGYLDAVQESKEKTGLWRLIPDVPKAYRGELVIRNFIDMHFTSLFRFLIACGMTVFALGQLGLLRTVSDGVPSLPESLLAAMGLGDLGLIESSLITGGLWIAIQVVVGVVLLVWTVVFIAVAYDRLQESKSLRSREAAGLPTPREAVRPISQEDEKPVAGPRPNLPSLPASGGARGKRKTKKSGSR